MQGALIIFALITFACAQSPVPPGGCCFYADKEYKNEVACTSSTFNISDITFDSKATFQGIQSFFCEDGWSAAIIFKGEAQELVDCGDTVPETTVPIPTDTVTIGPCLQRRCCFYSGKNKDGNEYCMYAGASVDAELKNAQSEPFLVGECLQDWKAEVTGKNGKINIDCGVTMDLDGKTSFDKITLTPCTAPKAFGAESVENTLGDAAFVDTFQDQAVADQAVVDQAVADQAVVDQAVADQAVVDQAVVDQAVADLAVVDQAVVDQAVADQAFADTFQDQAVADVAVVEDSLLVDNFEADQAAADLAVADENVDMFSEDLLLADASLDQAVADDTSFAVADVAVAEDALLAFDHGDESAFVADQAVVDQAVIDQAVADQAIIDQAVADQAVIDQAVIDQAVADFASADLFVGDYNDQAVIDAFDQQFLDNFADQAVGDNFDQVFGDQAFDAAVQDSAVTMNSSANSVFVTLAVVVASLVALLF